MQQIYDKTIAYLQQELKNAEAGHDWYHIERVYNLSKEILKYEQANHSVVLLSALLHDIADSKFHNGDETLGAKKARYFLEQISVDGDVIEHVVQIIENMSFKGGNFKAKFNSKEMQIVQDADRLDAIGAIGIARAFHYGGYKNRVLYNPNEQPNLQMSKEEYKNSQSSTLMHFYEKLLLLKDRMHTQRAKEIALERHEFMEQFIESFYKQWNFKVE